MKRSLLRATELSLLGGGIAAGVLFTGSLAPAMFARDQAPVVVVQSDEEILPSGALAAAYTKGGARLTDSSVIGNIQIPALRLQAPIIEGVTDIDLRKGVGHVPGSALGGGLGNVVLAGHRDQVFRPLRDIKPGMDITLASPDGVYHYRVDTATIVDPGEIEVMAIASTPQVTLITCYPFNFIGAAPKRFIVKAHLVWVSPDAPKKHG